VQQVIRNQHFAAGASNAAAFRQEAGCQWTAAAVHHELLKHCKAEAMAAAMAAAMVAAMAVALAAAMAAAISVI
jgi:hypothetical protein